MCVVQRVAFLIVSSVFYLMGSQGMELDSKWPLPTKPSHHHQESEFLYNCAGTFMGRGWGDGMGGVAPFAFCSSEFRWNTVSLDEGQKIDDLWPSCPL